MGCGRRMSRHRRLGTSRKDRSSRVGEQTGLVSGERGTQYGVRSTNPCTTIIQFLCLWRRFLSIIRGTRKHETRKIENIGQFFFSVFAWSCFSCSSLSGLWLRLGRAGYPVLRTWYFFYHSPLTYSPLTSSYSPIS